MGIPHTGMASGNGEERGESKKMAARKEKQQRAAKLKQQKDSLVQDSIQRGLKNITPEEIAQKAKNDSIQKAKQLAKEEAKKKKGPKQGAPMKKVGFLSWTDVTTSRSQALIENFFGESIQLHEDYLLEDELRNNCARPMFVPYRHWWNYAAEAILLLLFAGGIWAGRKHKFLWLALSYFALDLVLHIGLGFGLNEVYIMTAHWIYVVPIAMAYLCKSAQDRFRKGIIATIGILTVYLILYNGSLIFRYFCL